MTGHEAQRAALIFSLIGIVAIGLGIADIVTTGSGAGVVAAFGGVLMIIAAVIGSRHNRPDR